MPRCRRSPGKFELEYEGELAGADNVARDVIRNAVSNVFGGYFASADLRQVTEWFDLGGSLQIDDALDADELLARAARGPGPEGSDATRRRRRQRGAAQWRQPSTSCSKGCTRRRRSRDRTSSSIKRRTAAAARAPRQRRADRSRTADAGGRRNTTTDTGAPGSQQARAYELR